MGREKRSIEALRDEISSFFWSLSGLKIDPRFFSGELQPGECLVIDDPDSIYSEQFDNDNSTLHYAIKKLRSKLAALSVDERDRVHNLTFKNQKL